MWIVSLADNSNQMSSIIFSEKYKKILLHLWLTHEGIITPDTVKILHNVKIQTSAYLWKFKQDQTLIVSIGHQSQLAIANEPSLLIPGSKHCGILYAALSFHFAVIVGKLTKFIRMRTRARARVCVCINCVYVRACVWFVIVCVVLCLTFILITMVSGCGKDLSSYSATSLK